MFPPYPWLRPREDNYAREVLKEQYQNDWDSLTKEVVIICETVGLPNACEKYLNGKEVKEAMLHHHLFNLKLQMEKLSKLDRISCKDMLYMQSYMKQKSLGRRR